MEETSVDAIDAHQRIFFHFDHHEDTKMRIRISTSPPLSALKAWFSIPPLGEISTVAELKILFVNLIDKEGEKGIRPEELHLEVDGFELLDESDVGVVRDGELVV